MEIKNKAIIVTGASQGIGLAAARLLSREGAKIVVSARSTEALKQLEKELPESLAVPADMRNAADIEALVRQTLERFGRIDILVNNAGQGMYGPVEQVDIDQYRSIMELNVYGPLRAMQAVIPVMRHQGGGMIVNVSSRVSKNYFPGLAAYASTKYALNALSLTARAELAHDGIVISVLHPKMTATDFMKNATGTRPTAGPKPNTNPSGAPSIDIPEAVAEKLAELIRSGVPEAEM